MRFRCFSPVAGAAVLAVSFLVAAPDAGLAASPKAKAAVPAKPGKAPPAPVMPMVCPIDT